jgi:hypothetical protein
MPIFMKGSFFFVEPGQKCFEISSNYTNYLEIGVQGTTRYYLEAKIENDEFRISGTLLDKAGGVLCRLENNFIETSEGCSKEMTKYGYRIRDNEGRQIFEIQTEKDLVCHLRGTIYGDAGETVAQDREGSFVILRGPAIIGKSGNSVGIRLA